MEEIWKDIEGYEGLYQVSNLGSVRSVDRPKRHRNGTTYTYKGRNLSTCITHKGYVQVSLNLNGVRKTFRVHRLVAQAFLQNPNNLPQINHKDENKTNNRVENLEWCDNLYNSNYGTRNERVSKNQPKTRFELRIPVIQLNIDGTFVKKWSSVTEIQLETGYKAPNITACCRKKLHYNTAYGFIWRYASDVS